MKQNLFSDFTPLGGVFSAEMGPKTGKVGPSTWVFQSDKNFVWEVWRTVFKRKASP